LIDIEATRVCNVEVAREFLSGARLDADAITPVVQGKFITASVDAQKPATKAYCGSTCCAAD
jgi:hypothetical protein